MDAHHGALWSLCLAPDQVPQTPAAFTLDRPETEFQNKCNFLQRGLVTGGADKTVKFWDFELVKDQHLSHK